MDRLWNTFSYFVSINSASYKERAFCDALKKHLKNLDIETYEDDAGAKIKGESGNLYGFVKGNKALSPLLFSAHMDTVEPSYNKKAVLHEDGKITSQGNTILGADDVSGITIILEAITRLKELGISHRPLELLFPVVEERYGIGSAQVDYTRLKAKQAYTLDLSGPIGTAAYAAPTIFSFKIEIEGKAAHAGFCPEEGIHAIQVAAKAIAQIPQGQPVPGVTVNIGEITGGEANNIVPAKCILTGEIRSLSHALVIEQWQKIQTIFEQQAKAVGAKVSCRGQALIKAYETPLTSKVVQRFEKACEKQDIECNLCTTLGGSDQNNFALQGIQGLVLACSMHEVHSVTEYAYLNELEQAVQLVMSIITEETP